MNLYIARHGQTEWNALHKMQGRIDIELNDIGISQAYELNKEIKELNLRFDKIYVSPLKRALKTAMIATERDESEFIIDDRLIEMDFGELEGKAYHFDIDIAMQKVSDQAFNLFFKPSIYETHKGETMDDVINRAKSFYDDLLKEDIKEDENVLIIAHGALLHGFLYVVNGLNNIDDFWKVELKNAKLYKI
ncbi:MAG: histidine phosphatase family protein [Lachnospiraceae bacterium]|nr:histidine phosphatase family protein [Lachnospiraceae bacterium]